MNDNVIIDKIEVRSTMINDKPRYIVNGTALVANQKDIYDYRKRPDGSIRTLKSLFTENCIKSIKEQSKHKKLYVDSKHELALDANIKSLVKGKLDAKEEAKLNKFLKGKMLPLAKLNEIEIDDDSLKVKTELNPVFRNVDEDHKNYFDAVWYSLENEYLNGISINLSNMKAIEKDNEMFIDDVDVIGFSYVDAPAHHSNSITEVAIRTMQDSTNQEVDTKMEEDKKKFEEEKAKLAEDKKKFEEEQTKSKEEKEKADKDKIETDKNKTMEEQAAEHEKLKKELEEKNEALKKVADEKKELEEKTNSAKGVVAQTDPTNPPKATAVGDEVFVENLKKITAKHDETIKTMKDGKEPLIDNTMSGFGETISLGYQAGNPTADLSDENAAYIRKNRLLDRGGADLLVPRKKI